MLGYSLENTGFEHSTKWYRVRRFSDLFHIELIATRERVHRAVPFFFVRERRSN